MKTAAVIIDSWKLPIFKKGLDKAGYKYTHANGPTPGCITLSVETASIARLQPIIEKLQKKTERKRK